MRKRCCTGEFENERCVQRAGWDAARHRNDGVVSATSASFVSVTDVASVLDLNPTLGGHDLESGAFVEALTRRTLPRAIS